MSSLSINSLTKTYPDGTRAVDELSLEIADGEFLVLVGPSGCGKSTSLRMIAGLEQISGGEIRIGERVVNGVPPKDRNISMVFQNYALYPHMSVRKNLSFGLELRYGGGWIERATRRIVAPAKAKQLNAKRQTINERVEHAAELLRISHLLKRMPAQLSGGERQRVALGRAIVREPEVFLFDEPLSNLDAKLRVEMRRELKQLHARLGTTMIYVTHDQVEAMTLGDRVAVMHQGRLQQVGPPMQLYDHPANRFVASFLGSPSMNLLDCEVVAGGKLRLAGDISSRPVGRSGTSSRPVGRSGTPSVPSTDSPSTSDPSRTIESDDGRSATSSYDATIDLPESWRTRLAAQAGEQVTIGIRPEHVRLADDALASNHDTIVLDAEAVLVESLGDTTVATFQLIGGDDSAIQLVAKFDRDHRVATGDRRKLVVDAERLHLFTDESPASS